MENSKKILLNFYGVTVEVSGDSKTVERIESDFAFFCPAGNNLSYKNAKQANVKLEIHSILPDYSKLPRAKAKVYKENCISYDYKSTRYTDYKGKALSIYSFKSGNGKIFSKDTDLLYEISYLFIHSRAGELLDLKGIHRLHAAAFSYRNNIFVLMLPSGGGKTTFLIEAMKNPEVKMLSDDTPLINSKGEVLPFPVRLGICETDSTQGIDNKYITMFKRSTHNAKRLVSYEYFKNKVELAACDKARRTIPVNLICADRFWTNKGALKKISKISASPVLLKNLISGYGIPQVVEFFIKLTFKDFFVKFYIGACRFFTSCRFLLKCKNAYYFKLGNNAADNVAYFFDYFSKKTTKNH
ncbi:MAG: hypothetical protein FWC85_02170 [Elusimicrobia bacterium]|nr:hypothetical protein [Elusimicrobiota bacterium]